MFGWLSAVTVTPLLYARVAFETTVESASALSAETCSLGADEHVHLGGAWGQVAAHAQGRAVAGADRERCRTRWRPTMSIVDATVEAE